MEADKLGGKKQTKKTQKHKHGLTFSGTERRTRVDVQKSERQKKRVTEFSARFWEFRAVAAQVDVGGTTAETADVPLIRVESEC